MDFHEISPYEMNANPFSRIGRDWMLITAGDGESCNTMTASWGEMGILWSKPVTTVYIRPTRYTREFVEREARYSLCFFAPGEQKAALDLLGTKSGRDGNKIAEAGLHTTMLDGVPAFEEAEMVIICRVLYKQDLKPECFVDKAVDEAMYPDHSHHRMYVGEIEKVYIK